VCASICGGFLGYGFHERLPVHQTLSHAQTRRFVDGALFERLFLRSLDLCKQHGLVEGSHLSVDGFHAEANAALASLRASLALVAVEEPGGGGACKRGAVRAGCAAAAFARRAALGSDSEAQELEPDVGLAH